MGNLGTFSFFQVTHVFQGEHYEMKVFYLKCDIVLTELFIYILHLNHFKSCWVYHKDLLVEGVWG